MSAVAPLDERNAASRLQAGAGEAVVLPFPGLTPAVSQPNPVGLEQEAKRTGPAQSTIQADLLAITIASLVRTHWKSVLTWTVATLLLFAVAAGAGVALRPAAYEGETWVHSVGAGESLWGLAAMVSSDRPLDQIVEDIRELNHLNGNQIVQGQDLILPAQ